MNTTMLTERDISIVHDVVTYRVVNRPIVQRRRFPHDTTGRITRRRLQYLFAEGFINKLKTLFCHPSASPGPIYFPALRGCELLAERFDDERFLNTAMTAPIPHHTMHWLDLTKTHITLDEAIAAQTDVRIDGWINEFDIVNKDESVPEKRFQLYTLIRESPRLACAPDAAFLLSAYGHSKIFYIEQDRATSGVRQVANGKTSGYAALAERNLQSRHFHATVPGFGVLLIAPTARRRDALRAAIAEKPGAHLWKFACEGDVTPEKVLHDPIWFACGNDEPTPLVKKGASA
jgi:hypothetical protein